MGLSHPPKKSIKKNNAILRKKEKKIYLNLFQIFFFSHSTTLGSYCEILNSSKLKLIFICWICMTFYFITLNILLCYIINTIIGGTVLENWYAILMTLPD